MRMISSDYIDGCNAVKPTFFTEIERQLEEFRTLSIWQRIIYEGRATSYLSYIEL